VSQQGGSAGLNYAPQARSTSNGTALPPKWEASHDTLDRDRNCNHYRESATVSLTVAVTVAVAAVAVGRGRGCDKGVRCSGRCHLAGR
jgi:hypothetical protein